jgi:hypothetical protein
MIPTTDLVNRILAFCELYSGKAFYPYQEQFAKRLIRSVLENDGEEITALFARQCIPAGTLVHTRDGGLLPIESHPDAWLTRKGAPLYEIRARGGYRLRCTANHPIKTERGWKRADELGLSDKVQVLDRFEVFGDGIIEADVDFHLSHGVYKKIHCRYEMTDELAEFVGWIVTDGSFKQGQSLKFTNTNVDYLHRVERLSEKLFPDVEVKWYEKGGKGSGRHAYDLLFVKKDNNNSMRHFFNSLGIVEGFPTAAGKFTKSQLVAMFAAMFAADGYFNVKRKDARHKDRQLDIGLSAKQSHLYAQYCRELLNKLGISGQIKQEVMLKNRTGIPFNRVLISGAVNQKRFKELFDIPGKPFPEGFPNTARENRREIFKFPDGEEMRFSRVVAIDENAGFSDVYDLAVPGKGWFVCCGICVHNSGKTETVSVVVGGAMILLPTLANMPMFHGDSRFQMFRDGVWVGIFAPSQRQASITYNRMRARISCKAALAVLGDPEFNLSFTTSNGQTVALSNGSFASAISASDNSMIEGESFKILITEESQDISDFMMLKSIHPMGAAYNATLIKIGTPTSFKASFYKSIQRNKKSDGAGAWNAHRRHFEYDCDVAAKYNPSYAKYIEKEMARLGERSDEFLMSYKLQWIVERGMFVDIEQFERACAAPDLERSANDHEAAHVVGIDVGGKGDSTVLTVCEVDWSLPVIMESRFDDELGEQVYTAYNTYLVDWREIQNVPDYEEQYQMILEYLSRFRVARVVCDATREASLAHRLKANLACEVVPFIFTYKSKSDIYKHLLREIETGRAHFAAGENARQTAEYRKFLKQTADLQKGYRGAYLVVQHGTERDAHDDYPDSWCLAVWGCSTEGHTDATETQRHVFRARTPSETKAIKSLNRLMARRR